jgi:predicted RNase H-like nuclease (RuvC/YqgF family)
MKNLAIIVAVEPVSPGYVERLQRVNASLRSHVERAEKENRRLSENNRQLWNEHQALQRNLGELEEEKLDAEYQRDQLQAKVQELGCQNIALAADAERAEFAEQQLAKADERIKELEAALLVAKLPAGSRDNVIQLVREAA